MPRRRRSARRTIPSGPGALGGWAVFLVVLIALAVFASRKSGEKTPALERSGPAPTDTAVVATDRSAPPSRATSADIAPSASPHLFLGNPTEARPDPSLRDNYLLIRSQYALSYNDSKGTANWVSWRLRSSDLGDAPRQRTFLPDTLLPPSFYRVTHQDYTGSGFDRGHICPHSDRDSSEAASAETFLMTNIIPQAPNVNQRSWAMLEVYARELVEGGRNVLFVIAGPHGQGGVGSRGPASTVARGRVVVPETCWKIIVVVPAALSSDAARVSAGVRVIAVKVPNRDDIATLQWSEFRTTIADLQQLTGYRFLTNLSPQVAETLRHRLDDRTIPAPETPRYLR